MLSKPTKSDNSYYHYSANNTQTGDSKEQELSGQSDRAVGFRTGRSLRLLLAVERGGADTMQKLGPDIRLEL